VWLRATSAWEYQAAAEMVRARMLVGDAFTLAPAFALRPLEKLGDLRGVGLGAAKAGLCLGVRDLWVVAEPGAEEDLRALDRWYRRGVEERAGNLRVVSFRVAEAPGWHAATRMREARVTLFKAKGPEGGVACGTAHPKLPGFTCPGEPDWMRSTVEWLDVAGTASGGELAIWAHPPGAGGRKEYVWPGVEVGGRLALGTSHTEYGARSARAPVTVALHVGDRVLWEGERAPRLGWQVERLEVPPDVQGLQDLKVVVSTRNDAANHFVFDLGVVP
jgi:hypothetical protein